MYRNENVKKTKKKTKRRGSNIDQGLGLLRPHSWTLNRNTTQEDIKNENE